MSFEKIEAVIKAEAEAEAKKILDSERAESETLLARSREECGSVFEESVRQAEAAVVRETARQVGLARHEGRLAVLQVKNRVLDDVFRKAKERIVALPDAEYLRLMEAWLKSLPVAVGGTLRVSPRDEKRITKEFLDRVNAGRAPEGKFTTVAADAQISGGFRVAGGNYTVDSTIDNKIGELRESLAGELARELFGS
jgi:V/A-type H+/Na+-transporting ATPase subunit E